MVAKVKSLVLKALVLNAVAVFTEVVVFTAAGIAVVVVVVVRSKS